MKKNARKEINGQCHTKQVIDEHMIKMPVTPSGKPSLNRLTALTGISTKWRWCTTKKQADPNRLIALNSYFRQQNVTKQQCYITGYY